MYHDVPPGGLPPSLPHPPPPPAPPHLHFEMEPPSHLYPSRPRNPRDDRLVMNKHGSICPVDSEVCLCGKKSEKNWILTFVCLCVQVKAVEQAVTDVEAILKSISDDILDEHCKV